MYTDNHLNLEGVVRDHNKHVLMITFHERGSISISIPVKLVVLVDLCKYFAFKFPKFGSSYSMSWLMFNFSFIRMHTPGQFRVLLLRSKIFVYFLSFGSWGNVVSYALSNLKCQSSCIYLW